NSIDITHPELFNCLEIKLGIRWNRNQIEAAGFISTNIETNGLFEDIMKAYSSYYLFEQALLETRVHFYENVSFKPDGDYRNVKLKVGEIVEVTRFGESEPTLGKIMSIIEHSWNNNQEYVFLCFDWLENLNNRDSLLDCPVYRIQNNSSNRVHPISTVLHSSNIPFIHYCNSNCSFQQHDTTNN
ncbi:31347_t:CDS:1, partial [Gigaspora margarita]